MDFKGRDRAKKRLLQMTLLDLASLPATIDTEQASTILGVTPQAVRTLCAHGEFDCFRVGAGRSGGGPWRIVTADLLRYCNLTEHVDSVRRALEWQRERRMERRFGSQSEGPVMLGQGLHGRA